MNQVLWDFGIFVLGAVLGVTVMAAIDATTCPPSCAPAGYRWEAGR